MLRNNKFMYYKSSRSESPIRTINMLEASEVEYDHSKGRENCFRYSKCILWCIDLHMILCVSALIINLCSVNIRGET